MAHAEISVQNDPVDAIVAAAQQIAIESAQPVRHARHVIGRLPSPSNCPAGATFSQLRLRKSVATFRRKKPFSTTVQRIWARGPTGRSPPTRCEVSGSGSGIGIG